jgi:hypothetical protein
VLQGKRFGIRSKVAGSEVLNALVLGLDELGDGIDEVVARGDEDVCRPRYVGVRLCHFSTLAREGYDKGWRAKEVVLARVCLLLHGTLLFIKMKEGGGGEKCWGLVARLGTAEQARWLRCCAAEQVAAQPHRFCETI